MEAQPQLTTNNHLHYAPNYQLPYAHVRNELTNEMKMAQIAAG
jgi:hypothetical protein